MTNVIFFIGDILSIIISNTFASWFISHSLSPTNFANILLMIAVYVIFFYYWGMYRQNIRYTTTAMINDIVTASFLASLIYLSLAFLLGLNEYNRVYAIFLLVLSIGCITGYRVITCNILKSYIKNKGDKYNILIIGSKVRAKKVIEHILDKGDPSINILGCMDIDPKYVGKEVTRGVKIIGTMEDYHSFLLDNVVDEVIFAMPLSLIDSSMECLTFTDDLGIHMRILPNWQLYEISYFPRNAIIMFDMYTGFPCVSLSSTPKKAGQLFLKEITDFFGSLFLLILLSPLMAMIALVIKLSSPGPVLFKQVRVGLNGRKFKIYKFRTMFDNADAMKDDLKYMNEQDGPAFKIENDPRITPVGKFLRKSSLDELPQLINVLKGEMSLVGPRPPLPEEVKLYKPWQRRRLAMKPGITCIWQVYARNRVDFNTWMKHDLAYIDNWSYLLDLKLLIMTIPVIFKLTGK